MSSKTNSSQSTGASKSNKTNKGKGFKGKGMKSGSQSSGVGKLKLSAKLLELENEFILRLPQPYAEKLEEALNNGEIKDRLTIEMHADDRHGTVKFDGAAFGAKLVDMPCIVESWKTLDNKSFWKTADVSQMLICKDSQADADSSSDEDVSKISDPYKKQIIQAKKYHWPHGLTPPLKNVRKKRFRKTAKKKYIEAPEIEKEVKRLLRADISAVDVTYEVLNDDDKQDDSRSVVSDLDVGNPANISEIQEDNTRDYPSSDNEEGANPILPDISSSENEEDLDDKDIDISAEQLFIAEQPVENEMQELDQRIREIQAMLIDVRTRRAEQESRVRETSNPFLKQKFQSGLNSIIIEEDELTEELQGLLKDEK